MHLRRGICDILLLFSALLFVSANFRFDALHVSSTINCSVIRHKNTPKKLVHTAGKVERDIRHDAATSTLLHQSLSQPGSSQRPPLSV